MAERTATPDILDVLMSGAAQESNTAIQQENNKAIKQESNKTIEQVFEVEELKEKATFNLPKKILLELEDKCHEIRKLCGSKQISKTLIVEEALRMAFSEFDAKGNLSKFYEKLASNKAIKQ